MILFCAIPDEQNKAMHLKGSIREEWLESIGRGDVEALEQLYIVSRHAVYGFLLSIVKNQQDAEDLMQDTYIKIKTGAHLYKPQGKPLAWMFTIARNLAYMKLRRESQAVRVDYEDLDNTLDFSEVADHEERLALEAAFTILTDQERQIIILHANTGMKHSEIAALLQLSLSTVLSKYHRGLKKLRNYLEETEARV